MEKIWRFIDTGRVVGTAGFVIADDEETAIARATEYVLGTCTYKRITEDDLCIEVWNAMDDDDYTEDYPYALAI